MNPVSCERTSDYLSLRRSLGFQTAPEALRELSDYLETGFFVADPHADDNWIGLAPQRFIPVFRGRQWA